MKIILGQLELEDKNGDIKISIKSYDTKDVYEIVEVKELCLAIGVLRDLMPLKAI